MSNKKGSDKAEERNYSVPEKIGEKLKSIRKHNNWTQATILMLIRPDETKKNRGRISQYENGLRLPSLIDTLMYAKIANVSVETLIDDNLKLPAKFNKRE